MRMSTPRSSMCVAKLCRSECGRKLASKPHSFRAWTKAARAVALGRWVTTRRLGKSHFGLRWIFHTWRSGGSSGAQALGNRTGQQLLTGPDRLVAQLFAHRPDDSAFQRVFDLAGIQPAFVIVAALAAAPAADRQRDALFLHPGRLRDGRRILGRRRGPFDVRCHQGFDVEVSFGRFRRVASAPSGFFLRAPVALFRHSLARPRSGLHPIPIAERGKEDLES